MKYVQPLLASILAATCLPVWLAAQDAASAADTTAAPPVDAFAHRVGMFGSFNALLHRSDFNTLPGVPSCCSHYGTGTGTGFSAGLIYEHILDEGWLVGARLAYERVDGGFSDREPTTFIIDGHATAGAFEYRLDAGYGIVTLEPTIGYRLFEAVGGRLALVAGAGIGFGLKTGSDYTQHEEIVEPADYGSYLGGGDATRNRYSGTIPQTLAFMMDVRVGIGLEAAMDRTHTLSIAPELWYSLGMSPVANTINWSVDGLRAGLAIHYALPLADAPAPAGH